MCDSKLCLCKFCLLKWYKDFVLWSLQLCVFFYYKYPLFDLIICGLKKFTLRTTLVNFKYKEVLLYFLPHKDHNLPAF